jgi:hypothetical protein
MISLSLPGSTAAPCCAIVGLISCGALILPVIAPGGRCALRLCRALGERSRSRVAASRRESRAESYAWVDEGTRGSGGAPPGGSHLTFVL